MMGVPDSYFDDDVATGDTEEEREERAVAAEMRREADEEIWRDVRAAERLEIAQAVREAGLE